MKKVLAVLCALPLILTACGGEKKVTYSESGLVKITEKGYITVIGVAGDLLNNNGIWDENGAFYKIAGATPWPENIYGKKIKAFGKLMVYDKRKLMKGNPYIQGPAILNLLTHAKWMLIE